MAVCRLGLDSDLQMWFLGETFFAMLRSDTQLTVVCRADSVPGEVEHEAGWVALKIDGKFGFQETGVLESILKPLADGSVGVFALSTFETDYVLVKSAQLQDARKVLQAAGHAMHDQSE